MYDARLSLVAAHARRPAGGSHDVAGLAVARCYARAIGELASLATGLGKRGF